MSEMATISTFTGPISTVAHRLAQAWSRQQGTPGKSQQVFFNTLSVSFMNFYLECMGFETDIEASDSWNPVEQTLMDVADLLIKNLGKLECRPVLENAQFVYVPPEVQSNRIGYVAVEISASFQSAKLLGFVKEVSIDNLPINQLQPIDNLLQHLEFLELQTNQLLPQNWDLSHQNTVELQKWFENIFASGWSTIESILSTETAWQFRSGEEEVKKYVERAKLINFGIKANRGTVGIVVKVSHDENNCDEMKIIVELHPINHQEHLPDFLHVMILDEEGTAVMEAKAQKEHKKITLEFNATVGDNFSVKIALADVSIIENFAV
ncbi:hypothetical protein NIES2100_64570 [Calothrix sp. NIES-2100]|nr:hypothetical protein NIES2100_64570 [Calothrix sp. NIES-2100]